MNALALLVLLAPPGSDIVSSSALVDVAGYQAEKPFTVALQLEIEPEWHVYWRNPGDSGVATEANWTLPKGWKVSGLSYPTPTRYDLGTGYGESYGYSNKVTFLATLTPPKDAKEAAKFVVDISVLACLNDCLPADQTIEFTVPAGTGEVSEAMAASFAGFRKVLPSTASVKASKLQFDEGIFTLIVPPHPALKGARKLEFFPSVAGQVRMDREITQSRANDGSWTFSMAAGLSIKSAPKELPFLVIPLDREGNRMNAGVEFLTSN